MAKLAPPWKRKADLWTGRTSAVLNWAVIVGCVAVGVIGDRLSRHNTSAEVATKVAAGGVKAAHRDDAGLVANSSDDTGSSSFIGTVSLAAVSGAEAGLMKKERRRSPASSVVEKSVETDAVQLPASDNAEQWSEAEVTQGRQLCTALLQNAEVDWQISPAMRSNSCGTPAPIMLSAVGQNRVELAPQAKTNCQTAAALARWVDEYVQPAAEKYFGARVTRIAVATSYDCRNRYGQKVAPLSEHALANAVDISSFKLSDGRSVSVLGSWGKTARDAVAQPVKAAAAVKSEAAPGNVTKRSVAASKDSRMQLGMPQPTASATSPGGNGAAPAPATKEREFLHGIHAGACRVFGTVLGPEANEAHRDHFHLDMKQRKRTAFCE